MNNSNTEQVQTQEIAQFFENLGLKANVTSGLGNFENNYIVRIEGMREQHATGVALDLYADPSGNSEFLAVANVSSLINDGQRVSIEPALILPEERIDELRAIANDPNAMQEIKEAIEIQTNTPADLDIENGPKFVDEYKPPQF